MFEKYFIVFICILFTPTVFTSSQLCLTENCNQTALYLKQSINSDADPCNDFYEFACGGWISNHPLPDTRSFSGTFEVLNERIANQLKNVLENITIVDRFNQSVSKSVLLGKYLYDSCLNENDTDIDDILRELIPWNIGKGTPEYPVSWSEMITDAYRLGVQPIFVLYISPDEMNPNKNVFKLGFSHFSLGIDELLNPIQHYSIINAYKEYIHKSASEFCNNSCLFLEQDIENMFRFEQNLAKLKVDSNTRQENGVLFQNTTIGQLSNITNFDWLGMFFEPIQSKLNLTYNFTDDDQVVMRDVQHVADVVSLLNSTNVRTVANYVGWLMFVKYSPYSSEHMRRLRFEFVQSRVGVANITKRSDTCFEMVRSHLKMALSRLYVDEGYSDSKRIIATSVIDDLQEAFGKILKDTKWFDEETKAIAEDKIAHINKNVGFPTWILFNEKLDEYYGLNDTELLDKLLDGTNYLSTLAMYRSRRIGQKIDQVLDPVDNSKKWHTAPIDINASYEPQSNTVTIPSGMLNFPFFNPDGPYYLNYASIGSIVGHELTHSLDDFGRIFDKKGQFKDWWSNSTLRNFEQVSKCLAIQYSAVLDPITDIYNIADDGGLRQAYQAFQTYKTHGEPVEQLAELADFSAEQLFFIMFAQNWCANVSPQAMKLQVEHDRHAPHKYRVNVPLSNFKQFSDAFKCGAGSIMNPIYKCNIWQM